MKPVDINAFYEEVYSIVAQIPYGRVLTYGMIAKLAGYPAHSRLAGKAMAEAPEGLPCHRVVNSQGRTVPAWTEQKQLLTNEGVCFKSNGCVDLRKHIWNIGD